MKNTFKGKWLISFLIAFFLILPSITNAQEQKIRVVVDGASIRLQPDMESEIILSPPLGSVFEVEKKAGEWYEVKYTSEIGVLITGYIHEMFIEVEKEVAKPKDEVIQEPVRPQPIYEPPKAARPRGKPMYSLKGGGIFVLIPDLYSYEYSFASRAETATISEIVNSANAFSFEVGLGFFLIPNIEFEGTVSFLSKELTGLYGLEIPSAYWFNLLASDEMEALPTLKKTTLCFGLLIHPVTSGLIRPYFGGGGSYVIGNLEMVEDIIFLETDSSIVQDHSITIDEVQFVETNDIEEISLSKFGFYGKAGINFIMAKNIGIYAEGKYILAKKEVLYPLSDFDTNEIVEINLGGISFCLGIKLMF